MSNDWIEHNDDDAEFVCDDRVSRLPEPLREAMQKAMQELFSEGTTDKPFFDMPQEAQHD